MGIICGEMVVFIPGFMQRGDAWRPVAELLPERYPSALLDHREYTFEGRLREIAAAASPQDASPTGPLPVLVGYSLGGRLALRAVLREPGRYAGLVTLSTTAGIDEAPARRARAEADDRLAAWIEASSMEDVVGVWERQPLFADQSDALVEHQRPGRLSHDPAGLALLLRTAGQGVLEPVWHDLLRLDLPVLAIAGDRDDGYVRAARRIAETAPRGRAAVVPEAGHAPQLQQPEEVARLIVGFLEGLGRAGAG
jgi:2-succinyl-6-hydroxy-2,4-cyclohexadiene-1-carboxylate synthase